MGRDFFHVASLTNSPHIRQSRRQGGTLRGQRVETMRIDPAPFTPHLAPCTLHPAPCTPHPAPCTLHPAPCTLHPGVDLEGPDGRDDAVAHRVEDVHRVRARDQHLVSFHFDTWFDILQGLEFMYLPWRALGFRVSS